MAADVASSSQQYTLKMSPREIWRTLSREEQIQAAEAYLQNGAADSSVVDRLSRKTRFRKPSFLRQSLPWRAEKLAQNILAEELVSSLPDLLRDLHLVARKGMLIEFLDAAGVPHTDGRVDDGAMPPETVALQRGLETILVSHPPTQILTYLRTLLAVDPAAGVMWQNIPSAAEVVIHALQSSEQPASDPERGILEESQEEDEPESSEEFTTLDVLLIKTIVASAMNIEGALEPAKLDDITDELLRLNADRKRSFFHRGFLQALFDVDGALSQAGENNESRLWHLAGLIMGWMRKEQPERCVELFRKSPKTLKDVCTDENVFRVRMVLPVLYPILRDAGLMESAAAYAKHGLPLLGSDKAQKLVRQIIDDGSTLLRDGDAAGAYLLFQSVPDLPLQKGTDGSEMAGLSRRLARKKAQCLQAQGQFQAAAARLRGLSALGDFEESVEAQADLGLILSGFQSLYAVLPGKEESSHHSNAEGLERGLSYFEEAIQRDPHGTQARNAHFALGVYYCTRKSSEPLAASRHLSLALVGMLKNPELYEVGNLLIWARFLLGLSNLETCDGTRFRVAAEYLREALGSEVAFPFPLWGRCLSAAALFDDKTLAIEIAEKLLTLHGAKTFALIRGSGILEKSPELLMQYATWVSGSKRALAIQFEEWRFILKQALTSEQIGLAERSLDELEAIAHRSDEFTAPFLKLLETSDGYSPAWEPADADDARVRLLEARGRFDEASELLQKRFWPLHADRSPNARLEAESILLRLEEMRRPADELQPLKDALPNLEEAEQLEDASESEQIEKALRDGADVRILFVGGDERQARLDAGIRTGLLARYPGLRLTFEHPGWSSNWAEVCDQIEAHLRDYDAVVLSPLVRTNMGRRMRKMCDEETPWFACSGKGAEFISRSIAQAAHRILQMRKAAPKI